MLQSMVGFQGRRQGGAKGAVAPPPPEKKEKRERGEEERKKEEREKRNQKRKEVEPVIPRTCFHGLLVTPRLLTAPRPLTVMASAFRASRQPPLSKNPAYAPDNNFLQRGGDLFLEIETQY